MKLVELTEARYAGKYKNVDVLKQYHDAMDNQRQGVEYGSADVELFGADHRDDYVIARFIVNLDSEEDVRNGIKQFHEQHNIPLGEYEGLVELDDEWSVYIVYRGHQS